MRFAVWIAWEFLPWPDVGELAMRNPRTTAFIDQYREKRTRTGKGPLLSWVWVPYGRIAPCLKQAALVSEDVNFFSHQGFDFGEIWNSIKASVSEREWPRGASTITQQLAKNLWLTPSKDPARKLKEALLARQLEQHLTKKRILEIYLNVVEFGKGVYGAEAASLHYYGKHAWELNERQAAPPGGGPFAPIHVEPAEQEPLVPEAREKGRAENAKGHVSSRRPQSRWISANSSSRRSNG